jgi:hypothetical protein
MNVLSFTAEDIEYQNIGDQALLAKLYRPQGKGPFDSCRPSQPVSL